MACNILVLILRVSPKHVAGWLLRYHQHSVSQSIGMKASKYPSGAGALISIVAMRVLSLLSSSCAVKPRGGIWRHRRQIAAAARISEAVKHRQPCIVGAAARKSAKKPSKYKRLLHDGGHFAIPKAQRHMARIMSSTRAVAAISWRAR